jgi:hypothetical protein
MSYRADTVVVVARLVARSGVKMSAEIVSYWDFDMHRGDPLTCPSCGWTGDAEDYKDFHSDLFDVCCPECDRMILVVPFPTVAETRAAAASGNQGAAASLPDMEAQEKKRAAWARRADETMLRDADELPQLDGDRLVIEWDIEDCDGETMTILRHGDLVIWREIAFWEGIGRFADVVKILRTRYGSRLAEVKPTPDSELYLWGDKYGVDKMIEDINASLRIAE